MPLLTTTIAFGLGKRREFRSIVLLTLPPYHIISIPPKDDVIQS